MLGKRLTNALSNYTSLPRERNELYVSNKEIESKYDGIERAKDGNRKRRFWLENRKQV